MTPDETTTEEKSARSYWGFVLWPFVILVLYALSEGPACLANSKGLISGQLLDAYVPANTMVRAVGLDKPFRMYLHLWDPDAFDRHGAPTCAW
jgi:hypothetical protein